MIIKSMLKAHWEACCFRLTWGNYKKVKMRVQIVKLPKDASLV